MHFSPNSVSALRGSYGKCKGQCLIRVLTLGVSAFWAQSGLQHFPVNFCIKKSWHAFRPRRLAQSVRRGFGLLHFPVNFRIKWLLWNLDMRFDRAGSHKVCAVVLGCGIVPVNFRMKWLSWHVEVHFDCPSSRKVCAVVLGCGIFPINFRIKWLLWHVDMRFDCAGSHKVCAVVLGCGIFPINFRIKLLLWNLAMRFGSRKGCAVVLGCGIFLAHVCKKWPRWHVEVHFDCAGSRKVCLRSTSCLVTSCHVFSSPVFFSSLRYVASVHSVFEQSSHARTNSQNLIYLHKAVWNLAVNKQTHL